MLINVKMLRILVLSCILILNFNISNCEDICSLCDCKANALDCSEKTISVVPDNLKNGNKSIILFEHNSIIHLHKLPQLKVTYLSFAYNSINRIDDSAFKNLYNLTTLDLSNNYLTSSSLMPNVFKGNYLPEMYEPLRSLKELNLSNNLLHTLHPAVFEHLPYLEKLILSKNPLKVLNQGIVNALSSLPHLKELHLSNASLKVLPENIFHGPRYLEVIDLSYNQFREPPIQLENTHSLKWLSLDGNPFKYIESFMTLPFLQILHLSKMPELVTIKNRSLSTLPLLEEFYCSDNRKLVKISKDAFSARSNQDEEGEVWPPLKVLVLNNNALRYIESHLVSRWESLKVIDLQQNPWMCDCENQWLVSTLTPIIQKTSPEMLNSFQCSEPVEMKNRFILDLYHRSYEMRCLDMYDHTPEYDGKLLIDILILSIISAPLIMAALIYYKRKRRALMFHKVPSQAEFLNYSQLHVLTYTK
ncbi:leucine-rich repeat neuronal protein 1-like isoform X2 [Planococcus citri]|uniref:leucine-rich repeat neuronal protein 1-like isoform X2 n=1 Tax=Planococcus citri TaxID=170843 RepID=UPI0031F9798F